jgi:predicted transcriptional regulator
MPGISQVGISQVGLIAFLVRVRKTLWPGARHGREYQRLREMLVEARIAAGLTQRDLAKRLGRHQSFVSKYERGERRVDVIEFMLLAKVLGMDAAGSIKRLQKSAGSTISITQSSRGS